MGTNIWDIPAFRSVRFEFYLRSGYSPDILPVIAARWVDPALGFATGWVSSINGTCLVVPRLTFEQNYFYTNAYVAPSAMKLHISLKNLQYLHSR